MKIIIVNKKVLCSVFFLILFVGSFAQNYDIGKLKAIATIWGETYLFHPSVIRNDKNVEWEKSLVEFLPQIKQNMTTAEFIKTVNSQLLSQLDDPFTILQSKQSIDNRQNKIAATASYDYIKILEDDFGDISKLSYFDSLINSQNPQKLLVIDVRIDHELDFDYHVNSFMDYFAAMFVDKEIPGSMLANREHFGWDEYNDWWYYEQRWRIRNIDKSGSVNIYPFSFYAQQLQQYLPDFNFDKFHTIQKPIIFLTNNSFLSYFYPLMATLSQHKNNFQIINENNGKLLIPENTHFSTYDLGEFNFILHPTLCISNGIAISINDFMKTESITDENLRTRMQSSPVLNKEKFSFEITPKVYNSQGETLTKEEKILGIIKIWTIVKHFNVHPQLCDIDWEKSLEKYLEEAQKTLSDKEYYELIQEMMSHLHDSHVSTFHPSILDFSAIFVAPICFDYIENKVIVTAVDKKIISDIEIGDEIISIDGRTISKVLEEEKRTVSASNNQSFISMVINPGYFIDKPGSMMQLEIKQNNKQITKEIPRTVPFFQIMSMNESRENSRILKNNIGYLNISFTPSGVELEAELKRMQNTNSLIIDLRGFPPMWDYNGFLQMLFETKTVARISETPIISTDYSAGRQILTNTYIIQPNNTFSYNKPIAVLIDKSMISRSEDIAICLKALPNITFVGEQSQGTDGEMAKIFLPGRGETSFTGQRISYGNSTEFQGKGIIPDVKVSQTIDGIKAGKDEILEKAIEILSKK